MPLKINVKYQEKEEVKAKGELWDNEAKTWYVPNHKNYNDFIKWIDNDKFSIIVQMPFFIALNKRVCWKCSQLTEVIALASNNFYELDYVNEDDDNHLRKEWFKQDYFTFFSTPDYIDLEITSLIQQNYPFYRYGYSKTINSKYWANHCQSCNALQGDFYNHHEPGGAFSPISIEECKEITFIEIPSKFDLTLKAGTGWSSMEDMILEYSNKKRWS